MAPRAARQTNPTSGKLTVETSRFGLVEIDEDKVITMTTPLLGFPEDRHFFLKPHTEKSAFFWLQSLDHPTLAFVVIPPALINAHYQPRLDRQTREELQATSTPELDLLVILTIPKGRPQEMTANLMGPVVINTKQRLAKQTLLDPTVYDASWPVLQHQKNS